MATDTEPATVEARDLRVATRSGETLSLTVRELRRAEYRQCEDLQHATWGEDFRELVPSSMMMINQKLGGLVAGAFAPDGRLLAFVYGQTGVRGGRVFHWSHMLAVARDYRGLGLGRELKLFQRRFVLAVGSDEVEWTYDPLESRNAHLNLNRLGAEPVEYLRDVYGDGSTSGLHRGIGTDRFVVRWKLNDPAVAATIAGRGAAASAEEREAPIVNADDSGAPLTPPFELPRRPVLRVEVPADVQVVKAADVALAQRWRAGTRLAFEAYLGRGYRVPRLLYDPDSRRSFYVLHAP